MPATDGDVRPYRVGMLAEALEVAGHEVVVWTADFDHVRRVKRSRSGPVGGGRRVQWFLLPAGGFRKPVSLARVRHNRKLARLFRSQAAAETRPQLVYVSLPTPDLAWSAVDMARELGIPSVVDVRDRWPDVFLTVLPRRLRRLGRRVLFAEYRRARQALRHATRRIAISDADLDWAHVTGGFWHPEDRAFPLAYPDPGSRLATVAARDPNMVVFTGRFARSADILTIIEASRILAKRRPPVRFVIAGDGPGAARLQALAAGIPGVEFTGRLPYQELTELLARASVGLAPYSGDALQTLPNKPFEYWSAGVPVVTSLTGELRALIEDHRVGCCYAPGNPEQAAAAIERLLDDPDQNGLHERSRRLYEDRFRADRVYPQLVRYLEQVTAAPASN